MIKDKKYEVVINAANYKHYSKYFKELRCKQIIMCSIDQLIKTSRVVIDVICDNCGYEKKITFKDYNSYGFHDCVYYCRKCNIKRKNIEKYGIENVFQLESTKNKIKNTMLSRYGVENPSQSEEILIKKKITNRQRYSVDWPQQNDAIREKTKSTNIQKWNVDNISKNEVIKKTKKDTHFSKTGFNFVFETPEFKESMKSRNLVLYGNEYLFNSEIIKQRIKKTNFELYGYETPSKNEIVKSKIRNSVIQTLNRKTLNLVDGLISINSVDKTFVIHCQYCESEYTISYSLYYKRRETLTECCTMCNPIDKHQSGMEIMLFNWISSVTTMEIIQNYKLEKNELDIYIPEIKLAIEFNGLYWHSEIYKDKYFHKNKTDVCKKNGITLLHIWEDDWKWKNDIVKSMILIKLNKLERKIPARKCKVEKIVDFEIVKNFLNQNHIQGSTNYSVALGCYFEKELVSVMTFIRRKSSWELNRFCSSKRIIVVGAASKLLNTFKIEHIGDITTFSNSSYSLGNLYKKLGFEHVLDLRPDYSYLIDGSRKHKFNFRNQDTSKMIKVWDAGKSKFILRTNHIDLFDS